MKRQPPFDPAFLDPVNGIYNSNPDAAYVNGDPRIGRAGSIPPFEAVDHPQKEIVEVIKWSGQTPSHEDLTQLRKALQWAVGERLIENVGGGAFAVYGGLDAEDGAHLMRTLSPGAGITMALVEEPDGSGRHRIVISAVGGTGGGGDAGGGDDGGGETIAITIPNSYQFNLASHLALLGYDLSADLDVVATLPTNGILGGGGSPSNPQGHAFDTGTGWTPGSTLKLVIASGAHIIGKAGWPANGESAGGGNGSRGGPALIARRAITIQNNGTIAGGGGGGAQNSGIAHANLFQGVGGGFGAGVLSTNPSQFKLAYQYGTATGYWNQPGNASTGGAVGGAWGQPGGNAGGYTGGAAGAAVVGNSHITWEATGTRLGSIS